MRLWDIGADGISVSAAEAEKLVNITTHPPLRHRWCNLRQYKGYQSLMEWLI